MANLTVDKVLSEAAKWVGYLEKKSGDKKYLYEMKANAGNNNYTCFWDMMKPSWQGQAWCNCFVNACFVNAYGEENAKKLLCTKSDWCYYTPDSAKYFYNNNQWFKTPKVGDIIYFRSDSAERQGRWKGIHHVGIVRKVSEIYVYTIEGNTASGTEVVPNGGEVAYKQYLLNNPNIAGYGRPKYDDVQIVIEPCESSRAGLRVTASSLNVRKDPDAFSSVVGAYAEGDAIYPTEKCYVDGTYWFKTSLGWVSGKYLIGWVNQFNRWWYLKNNTYPMSVVMEIDGHYYAFDKNGWMIDKNHLTDGGEIIL